MLYLLEDVKWMVVFECAYPPSNRFHPTDLPHIVLFVFQTLLKAKYIKIFEKMLSDTV